jgi:putative NADPH-quinone reductase
MRVLVVYCHPCDDSFVAAMKAAALEGLAEARHEVRLVDLYAEDFRPHMTAEERRRYHDEGANTAGLEVYIDHLRWAEAIVFVYPTWWYGLPAMLKGWFDRVFVPHVVFLMPTETRGVRGNLGNIRRLVVVTSCGASWFVSKVVGEPGRKTILRGLRTICVPWCRTRYLALYKMDTVPAAKRAAHLDRIRRTLARLR